MRRYVVLCTIMFHMSCSDSDKIPDHILTQEKMSEVFSDITLAEGYVEAYFTSDSLRIKDSVLHQEIDKVLLIHDIDQSKFRESYDYYRMHPTLFKVVIDTAYARAQRSRDKLYNRKPSILKSDSLSIK